MAVCVLGLCGLVLLGGRAVSIRRQARLHDFYAGWFARKAAAHLAAARDCEEYGGAALIKVARDYRSQSESESRRADHHARLSRRYWRVLVRPWLVLPADPKAPEVP